MYNFKRLKMKSKILIGYFLLTCIGCGRPPNPTRPIASVQKESDNLIIDVKFPRQFYQRTSSVTLMISKSKDREIEKFRDIKLANTELTIVWEKAFNSSFETYSFLNPELFNSITNDGFNEISVENLKEDETITLDVIIKDFPIANTTSLSFDPQTLKNGSLVGWINPLIGQGQSEYFLLNQGLHDILIR